MKQAALTKITENVYQLTLPIVNVFFIDHASGLILIDTGPKGSRDLIFEGLQQIGKQPVDLKYILLTHAHHDHSGSLVDILRTIDVPVYASARCAEMIQKGIAFQPESNLLNFLLRLITLFGLIRLQFMYIEPVKSTIKVIQEGNKVPDLDGLEVIAAPGHCAEQLALFYLIKEALLFAADSAKNLQTLKPAFAYQSAQINQQTLNKFLKFPFKLMVFGHGSSVLGSSFKKMLYSLQNL